MKRAKNFWTVICPAVLLCLFLCGPQVAHASLVLKGGSVAASFTDLGAQGFGNAPRMLTLQNTGQEVDESGRIVPTSGGGISEAGYPNLGDPNQIPNPLDSAKNSAPTLTTLGWISGANVAIGLNIGDTGSSPGFYLTGLTLYLYNGTTLVDQFDLSSIYDPGVFFGPDAIAAQQGNGNAVFTFVLDAAQQAEFNADIVGADLTMWRAALGSSLEGTADGPDSFVGFNGGAPVPIPPAVWLLGSGLLGLIGIRRRFWK